MRMVLKSSDSPSVHPNNRPTDFRVRLPRPFPLEGKWTVELTEFHNTNVEQTSDCEIFVFSSICDESIVGEHKKPLLRQIVVEDAKNVIYLRPYRIPLRLNNFSDVHVYIRDKQDRDVSFLTGESTVTLVLRRL